MNTCFAVPKKTKKKKPQFKIKQYGVIGKNKEDDHIVLFLDYENTDILRWLCVVIREQETSIQDNASGEKIETLDFCIVKHQKGKK